MGNFLCSDGQPGKVTIILKKKIINIPALTILKKYTEVQGFDIVAQSFE